MREVNVNDTATILLTVAGAAASWLISRRYYQKSGTDLDAALKPLAGNSQQLLQATNTLARMLESAGIGKPVYDEAGNLTGIRIEGSANLALSKIQIEASGTVINPPKQSPMRSDPGQDAS